MRYNNVKIPELNPLGNLISGNTILVCVDLTTNETYKLTLQNIKDFYSQNPVQLPLYSSNSQRDTSITSPVVGMMIFVDGEGMQVRGNTSWNTIVGSST